MTVLKRLLAVLFVVVGAGLAIHFVLDPVLYDWEGGQPVLWHVFDWARAVSLPLAVIATFEAKHRTDSGADLRTLIEANLPFYLALGLTLLFYWNWVQVSWAAGDQRPDAQVFVFIDVVLPLVFVPLGLRLWREASTA